MLKKILISAMPMALSMTILTGCDAVVAPDPNGPETALNYFCNLLDEGKSEGASRHVAEEGKEGFKLIDCSWDEISEVLDTFEPFADVSQTVNTFQSGIEEMQIENAEVGNGKYLDDNTYQAEITLDWLTKESVYKTLSDLDATGQVDSDKVAELSSESNNIAYNYIYKTMYGYLNEHLSEFKDNGEYTKKYFDVVLKQSNQGWLITEISEG